MKIIPLAILIIFGFFFAATTVWVNFSEDKPIAEDINLPSSTPQLSLDPKRSDSSIDAPHINTLEDNEMAALESKFLLNPDSTLRRISNRFTGRKRMELLEHFLKKLAEEDSRNAIDKLETLDLTSSDFSTLQKLVLKIWLDYNPGEAAAYVSSIAGYGERHDLVRLVASSLATSSDIDALKSWLPALDRQSQDIALGAAFTALLRVDAGEALRLALKVENRGLRARMVSSSFKKLAESDPSAALRISYMMDDPGTRYSALSATISEIARTDLTKAASELERIPDDSSRRAITGLSALSYAQNDIPEAAYWFTEQDEKFIDRRYLSTMADQYLSYNAESALKWISTIESYHVRDQAIEVAATKILRSDPDLANQLSDLIHDPEVRQRVQINIKMITKG